MICNQCRSPMIPTDKALIPAMMCVNEACGRIVPRTGVKHKESRGDLNRALRAARRRGLVS